jgi:hypothetical protein
MALSAGHYALSTSIPIIHGPGFRLFLTIAGLFCHSFPSPRANASSWTRPCPLPSGAICVPWLPIALAEPDWPPPPEPRHACRPPRFRMRPPALSPSPHPPCGEGEQVPAVGSRRPHPQGNPVPAQGPPPGRRLRPTHRPSPSSARDWCYGPTPSTRNRQSCLYPSGRVRGTWRTHLPGLGGISNPRVRGPT